MLRIGEARAEGFCRLSTALRAFSPWEPDRRQVLEISGTRFALFEKDLELRPSSMSIITLQTGRPGHCQNFNLKAHKCLHNRSASGAFSSAKFLPHPEQWEHYGGRRQLIVSHTALTRRAYIHSAP